MPVLCGPGLKSACRKQDVKDFQTPTTHGTLDLNAPLMSSVSLSFEVLGFVVGGEREKRQALKTRRGLDDRAVFGTATTLEGGILQP